ncbi:hypothetical protein ABB37_08124 [Leptomonas pyrrhocoris]|uniref:Uncharacterized protein n=1 Tax=Leptomonas pyrrhocoris TaxID=157538 RepID=A0A0N0DSE4_LEPPY|nr:hypothetical protein ABB37_08124 [Leptomonas pyrrhocoris]KPA75968.1 hypothetical protein ABB37_08124 [Leptomonas pyrrhocoris]|eukprot:XP_015654407.1 hypothetical protein ABB37_08124 [Leptomonas pyrrhocoris]
MQDATGASSSPFHAAKLMEELLRENTSLRARLHLSDEQRVTQEVLREQLQQFLQRVAEDEARASQVVRNGSAQRDEGSPTEDGSPSSPLPDEGAEAFAGSSPSLTQTVSVVLRQMQQGKQQAEEALEKLQSQTVAPLHAQLEAAESERKQLMARITDLEMSMANTPPPPLVAELKQLRESEALLRRQLQETQEAAAGTVGTFRKSIEDSLRAARQVPELLGKMEALKEELRISHNVQAAQRVLMDELERRHGVEREIEDAFRKDETNMLMERIGHLRAEVGVAVAREAAVVSERDAKDEQLIAAQNEIKNLIQLHSEEQQALAQKRQRAEQDASSNPSSIRGEMTKFWYEGRDRIRELERQVRTLQLTQADLRVSQGRVAQLEQRKAVLTDNLAALASEVDRRRDEERELRAHCAGVEAERDRLLTSVALTIAPVMSEQELRACCATIREAATRVAATSATVVADPHAIEEALRRSQKLKSEVAQLQRQKDQLQRFLQLREDRVRALMEQEALILYEQQQRLSSAPNSPLLQSKASEPSSGVSAAAAMASFSLPQFLEYLRQGANDVFLLNEVAAARGVANAGLKKGAVKSSSGGAEAASGGDNSVAPHRNSFVALQQQFQQSQERLLASHRELLETRNENRRLQSEVERSQQEHAAALTSQEEARRAVEAANAALTYRTKTLDNELQAMHKHYTAAVEMVRTTLEGLCTTLQLYHQSEQHTETLREMVQAERRDMGDLLRREAASWGAAHGGEGDAQEAEHSAAADKITAALRQMQTYMTEAIHQTTLQASRDQTSYIGQLVQAIQEQEERVKTAKAAFEASAQAQASSLVERISAAQQQWESTWKAKYQAMEAERTQSVMQQHASVVLQRALEQAVVAPAHGGGGNTASPADDAPVLPAEVEESAAHMSGTLQAIRSFITHARQRQEQQQREELQRLQQQQRQQQEHAAVAAAAATAAMPPPPPLSSVSVAAPTSAASTTSPLTPASPAPSLVPGVSATQLPPASASVAPAPVAAISQPNGASAASHASAGPEAVNEEEEGEVKPATVPIEAEHGVSEAAPVDEEQLREEEQRSPLTPAFTSIVAEATTEPEAVTTAAAHIDASANEEDAPTPTSSPQ